MKWKRIEVTRAREVTGPEIFRCARIDDHQVGVASMLTEPSRVDEKIRS
jgi:hypothetical protein